MTVLFHDVDTRLLMHDTPCNTWSVGKPVYDLEYADDTAQLAIALSQSQKFLHAVEVEATLYNLSLNKDSFANGDPVPTTPEAKYLCPLISCATPPKISPKTQS